MALQTISLGVRSNPERTNDDGATVLINCYAEDAGEEGKARFPLYACDSFEAFSTLTGVGAAGVRGMLNLDDATLYVVTGSRLNRVTPLGVASDIATIEGDGVAYLARNRRSTPQVAIVPSSGGKFYILEDNVLSEPVLDGTIPKALFNSVCAIDGFFVITLSNGEWYITAIDGSSIDELDFSTAASNPDGLTRGIVRSRDLCLMGPRSTEFFQNSGGGDFPFERTTATTLGIFAGPTAVALSATLDGAITDTVIWAATNSDGAYIGILMLGGYNGRKVSAPWVDRAVRDCTPSTLRAFAYTREGTTFYVLTADTFTAEYNTRTGFWHRRQSSGMDRWRIADAASFGNRTVFGDVSTAQVYRARHDIVRTDASILTFRQSETGGSTWNTARSKPIGGVGATSRVKWTRLGQMREDGRVFEFSISNAVVEAGVGVPMTVRPPVVHAWPSPTSVYALHVDVTTGASQTGKPMGIGQIAVDIEGALA